MILARIPGQNVPPLRGSDKNSLYVHTLQWATAVAGIRQSTAHQFRGVTNVPVFFLPKHCTPGVEDMVSVLLSGGYRCRREGEKVEMSGIPRLVRASLTA